MFAVQLKLRLRIVIEPPYFPAVRRMAAITVLPQFPFVTIVLFVTGIALQGGILVRRRQVAFLTGYDRVKSDEREFGKIVVETHFPAPTLLIVTVFTLFALLPFVHIIQPVTAVAVHLKLYLIYVDVLLMARDTFYLTVFSL